MSEDSKPPSAKPSDEEVTACREWRKRKRGPFLSRSLAYQCAAYADYRSAADRQRIETLENKLTAVTDDANDNYDRNAINYQRAEAAEQESKQLEQRLELQIHHQPNGAGDRTAPRSPRRVGGRCDQRRSLPARLVRTSLYQVRPQSPIRGVGLHFNQKPSTMLADFKEGNNGNYGNTGNRTHVTGAVGWTR